MKKISLVLLAVVLLTAGPTKAQSAPTAPPDLPTEYGVYAKTANGWMKLDPVVPFGAGPRHVARMFVPTGFPQIVLTFRDPVAPLELTEAKPIFYVRQATDTEEVPGRTPRDLMIVSFDRKKDHRELAISSGGSIFTLKAGLDPKHIVSVAIEKIEPGLFSISPKAGLLAGEYLITYGLDLAAYDSRYDRRGRAYDDYGYRQRFYGYDFGVLGAPKKK